MPNDGGGGSMGDGDDGWPCCIICVVAENVRLLIGVGAALGAKLEGRLVGAGASPREAAGVAADGTEVSAATAAAGASPVTGAEAGAGAVSTAPRNRIKTCPRFP